MRLAPIITTINMNAISSSGDWPLITERNKATTPIAIKKPIVIPVDINETSFVFISLPLVDRFFFKYVRAVFHLKAM